MRKVKLIFGTYNSQPPEEDSLTVDAYYQKAYKIFLTTMYNYSTIKITQYYSGALLEWIEETHPEFISVLQEMIKSKQVELLSGGYYEPAQTLLPVPDRVGQMEKLTTFIRKNFSKKPRGCFLTESVWDSSLLSSLKSCGFDYIFLDDNQFLSSGIPEEKLSMPVLTEDQGKIITVIPISSKLTSMFLRRPPVELIEYLQNQDFIDGVFTIMLKGEFLKSIDMSTAEIRAWVEEFNELLVKNSSWIETISPGKYVKQIQGSLQRVYFPQYSINGMRNKPLPIVGQKELIRLNRHLEALGDISHWINSGFFKQFISRYTDSSLLYSKMIYINLLVNQIKGDRSRKKTAREELWRAQSHYVYWHGIHLGIYDKSLRERSYRFLIEAEKSTREKGIFKSGINHFDIDLDGKKEALYEGDIYNAYISCKGGVLFQFDHLKKNKNLIATVMRIQESYHTEEHTSKGFDTYSRKMFHDHFISDDITIDEFQKQSFKELGTFIGSSYEYNSLNREKKSVVLTAKGSVHSLGNNHGINIEKKYHFNKNSTTLTYKIENLDDFPIDTIFAPEFNLSLGDIGNEIVPLFSSDNGHSLLNVPTTNQLINNLIIDDVLNKLKVHLSFTEVVDEFWSVPQYSDSMDQGTIREVYQFTSFLPQWKIKLAAKQTWSVAINISLS